MIERRVNWHTAAWSLWGLEKHGRDVQCIIAMVPYEFHEFEVRLVSNGSIFFSHTFGTWAEARKWAAEKRIDLELEAWIPDAPSLQGRAS